ncbi:MAG TPA: glycerate kinase [Actinomycetota bacterium]|jgi:glycerate 2-kinase|nr:glycerate kinase [Actinomycetota bacterium]
MRIVVAPDKFKGTLSARAAAVAIAAGLRRRRGRIEIVELPLADGGDGTIDAICRARRARLERCRARDPLGRPVEARFAILDDGRAVVEVAEVGLGRIAPAERDPVGATSAGVGDILVAAVEAGARSILLGIGGSASTDGGTGMAATLGWRFVGSDGSEVPAGGGGLRALVHIEPPRSPLPVDVVGLYDVDNALVGDRGAAKAFAPQKGAGSEDVDVLEGALMRLAELVPEASAGVGAGAGGGIGFGIVSFLGGRLVSGFDAVADLVELDEAIAGADLVVTGEGRLDEGSFGGKVPIGVARRSQRKGVPCAVLAGEVAAEPHALRRAGVARWTSLVDAFGERARTDTFRTLSDAAADLVG